VLHLPNQRPAASLIRHLVQDCDWSAGVQFK
jgi:hypothetical protein